MKQNSSEMDSHKCSQLIFEKGAEIFQWKRTVFSKNDVETTGYSDAKKKKSLYTDLTSFTKITSVWIIDLNVKYKTVKLPENDKGENLRLP